MSLQVIISILAALGTIAYFIPTPQELRESFVAGQNYFAARNFPKAVEQYDKVLAIENDLLTADSVRVTLLNGELEVGVRSASIYQKGNAYRTMNQFDSAIATFRSVLTRTDSPKLLVLSQYQIYDLFLQKKEYDSAISAARELITNHPFDEKIEQAYYDIGWAFRFHEHYDSSSATFQTLIDRYPNSSYHVRAMYQIGQNHLDAQHWKLAVNAFSNLIQSYKPESFSNTDFESMELRVNRERRIFDAASNREEDNTNLELVSKAEFKVAEAYEKMNNIDSAVARYRYIISTYTLIPSLIEISYIRWSELMHRVNGLESAIGVYRKAIDENFQNKVFQARMQYKIARTYQDNKEYERSAVEYAFYVKAYDEYAEQAEFSLENARFFSVLNFNAAKIYSRVTAASDSFLEHHAGSEFTAKVLIIRGNAFLNVKQFSKARQSYSAVTITYPSSEEAPHAKMQYAKSFYDEKNYPSAIREYESLADSVSDEELRSEIQYFLGMSQFYSGNNEKAQTELLQVHTTSQFYPFAFGRIAKIYSAANKTDEGIRYISGIIATLPDSSQFKPYAHLTYGEMLASTGKFDDAVQEMSIVLNDSSVVENARLQARYARGALFQQIKKYPEAITDLEYCLSQPTFNDNFSTSVPSANEKLALSYVGVGRKKEAIDKIVTLLEQVPSNALRVKYLSALAELYVQLNEHQKVVDVATQVIRTDSADENTRAKAYGALSNSYGNLNNYEKIVETLREAADTLPTHPYVQDILWKTAMLFYDGQGYVFAEKLFAIYIETYPSDLNIEHALQHRAVSLSSIGKVDESVELRRQFISQFPEHSRVAQTQYEIAETYYNAERFDLAVREYNHTMKDHPQSEFAVTAAFNKAWCFYRMGDSLMMVESFDRFVKTYPNSEKAPDAQFSIGDYYYNNKEYEKAKKAYRSVIDTYPSYARAEEAKSLVHELDQINSFQDYARAMGFFDNQNFAEAIPLLEEVIKKYPDADVRYACEANIASSYSELGNKKKALEIFIKIIEKYSDTPNAQMVVFFAEQHKRWLESKENQ
ncbi:MAG: tetratricopeptide repeat protein [Bacteroidetes bacterium]|nr:tetratricopeptide repeat protein [Bacteroidota bacterium]